MANDPIRLADGVSFVARPEQADRLPGRWQSIAAAAPVIFVGVSGVGARATLQALADRAVRFRLLPDRAELTDTVVIGTMQTLDGRMVMPVTDRAARQDYVNRYRKMFPGGLAHALTRLVIDPQVVPFPVVFNGLRDRDEVTYAAAHLPNCRFVELHAADDARVKRLVGPPAAPNQQTDLVAAEDGTALAALKTLPSIDAVFSHDALVRLSSLVTLSGVAQADLLRHVATVVAERRTLDPVATLEYLRRHVSDERLLAIDSSDLAPDEVAARVAAWL